MSPTGAPVVRGWCPGVFDPLLTGDGWLVRVRLPGGVITPAGVRLVADLAAGGGSGQVELTSRGNLQLRGLHEDVLDVTGRALVEAGLAAADARTDSWRAIVASPLAGHDPAAVADTGPLVAELAARLPTEVDGPPPSKFGIVVDDGGSWPLGHVDADLHLSPAPGGGWSVGVRGQHRHRIDIDSVEWVGNGDEPGAVALAAAQLCAAEQQRMDGVIAARGSRKSSARSASHQPRHRSNTRPPTTGPAGASTQIPTAARWSRRPSSAGSTRRRSGRWPPWPRATPLTSQPSG